MSLLTWKIRFWPGSAASTISSRLQLALEEIYAEKRHLSDEVRLPLV
jgi:hypothetical protein